MKFIFYFIKLNLNLIYKNFFFFFFLIKKKKKIKKKTNEVILFYLIKFFILKNYEIYFLIYKT